MNKFFTKRYSEGLGEAGEPHSFAGEGNNRGEGEKYGRDSY
jgi:hypothetical protein